MNAAKAGWYGWAAIVVLVLVIGLFLPGCALDRYLTAEQDEELRQTCEATGCKVVPAPLWEQIEAWLRAVARGRDGI